MSNVNSVRQNAENRPGRSEPGEMSQTKQSLEKNQLESVMPSSLTSSAAGPLHSEDYKNISSKRVSFRLSCSSLSQQIEKCLVHGTLNIG